MKIKNYILAAVSCVLVSCSALELGPIDNYGLNNYWNNKEQCERFIIGLHLRMRSQMSTTMIMGEHRGGTLNANSITSTKLVAPIISTGFVGSFVTSISLAPVAPT